MTNLAAAMGSLLSPTFWRSQLAKRQAQAFDRRYGTDTRARLDVADMKDVDPELARHAVHYEASAIPKFKRALNVIARRLGRNLRDYSFIDIGSGKGLVVMLASRWPFKAVYGVEMTPELHRIAGENVRAFRAREPNAAPIELRCMDALRFELPAANLVVYLYNPFDAELTARFLEKLERTRSDTSAPLLVAYINPLYRDLFETGDGFRTLYADHALAVYEKTVPGSRV